MTPAPSPSLLPDAQDLIEQLKGADGAATRQRLLERLDALQGRLLALKRAGMPQEEFPRLEATLAAVDAARAALAAVRVGT